MSRTTVRSEKKRISSGIEDATRRERKEIRRKKTRYSEALQKAVLQKFEEFAGLHTQVKVSKRIVNKRLVRSDGREVTKNVEYYIGIHVFHCNTRTERHERMLEAFFSSYFLWKSGVISARRCVDLASLQVFKEYFGYCVEKVKTFMGRWLDNDFCDNNKRRLNTLQQSRLCEHCRANREIVYKSTISNPFGKSELYREEYNNTQANGKEVAYHKKLVLLSEYEIDHQNRNAWSPIAPRLITQNLKELKLKLLQENFLKESQAAFDSSPMILLDVNLIFPKTSLVC